MTGRTLRGYQTEAVAYLKAAWSAGIIRPPAVLATGLGKTEIFTDPTLLNETLDAGKRVLIIAHTDELIDQAARKARRNNPLRRVGIVKAERNETYAQIIVSSRQTLGHATGGPRRLAALRNVGLIVIDEAHHALRTNTYGKILEHFGAFTDAAAQVAYTLGHGDESPPGAVKVAGFTATLARGDKGKLSTVWQEPPGGIFKRDILFGIRRGYLLDVSGKRVVVDGLDMKNVRQTAGDYRDSDIAEELERTFAPEVVAAAYAEHAVIEPIDEYGEDLVQYRKGIAFWPLVDTAYHGAEAFNEAGIRSEVIHGNLPKVERRAMLARLHSGQTRVIHGVGVLTEGFDEPTCDVVVVARPTRSAPLYQQMVGRVLRPNLMLPPSERGKALVLDVVGAGANHDLRSLIDLSPERPLSAAAEQHEDFSLLELDEWVLEELEGKRAGASMEFEGAEDYAGPAAVLDFDPLGRSQLWAQTPGGNWYMGAGGSAYAFLVPSLAGEPSHFDVVLCSKVGPYSPSYDQYAAKRKAAEAGQLEGWAWARATEHTDLPLEQALGWAEEEAMAFGGFGAKTLTGRKSAWRKGPPKPGVLKKAAAMRLRIEEDMTAGEVSELIDAEFARLRVDPLVKQVTESVVSQS